MRDWDAIGLSDEYDEGGFMMGDGALAAAAAERARFFVYAYNTSTLVTTAGLALGIFFLVTAIALYAYYYSTADEFKNKDRGGWQRDEDNAIPDTSRLAAGVLGLLEQAWAGYGVEEQACRRRVSCEASLWASQGVNMPSAVLLSGLIGQVTYEDVVEAGGNAVTDMYELRQAAERGGRNKDCQAYEHDCPHVTIASLPKIV
ncbi:uncharacterized protein LOC127003236 [Eriocheir sinensis]|uniref:uncharacterized protein LOC127003236 n=1 Tax=Eriocheir sinensis TaxID=95602 RepID=UPI0021CA694C|nr:uncharacterized protein LOC127003236 [Eriocheir sinensis]